MVRLMVRFMDSLDSRMTLQNAAILALHKKGCETENLEKMFCSTISALAF